MMRMTTTNHHHHHRYPVRGSSSITSLLLLLFLLTVFPHLLLLYARSYSITSATWTWRGRYPIAYERATRHIIVQKKDDDDTSKTTTETTTTIQATETTTTTTTTPVLLLNGFGVGSFHQHRLIHELLGRKQNDNSIDSNDDNNIVVYCIDYLGQGSSWPLDCNDGQGDNEVGLRYCGNTWVDQIVDFIREVIILQEHHDSNQNKKKVLHIVGNSVGGHLAAYVAAKLQSQDFIASSLCLLNPTPFWGLNLPGWDGTLPAPIIPKLIGRFLFDQIRDLHNIKLFLQAVYANGEEEDLAAFDDTLVQQIRACTNGPGGHAAFASILWSPPVSITVPTSPSPSSSSSSSNRNDDNKEDKETVTINNFYDCLAFLANNNNSAKDDDGNKNSNSHSYSIPILLVFGQSDPWCKPALARRMLQHAKCARYMEMTNVGHCPNHEAPIATAHILNAWWKRQQLQQQQHSKTSSNNLEAQWLPQHGGATGSITIQESWGTTRLQEKSRDEIPLNLVDRLTTAFV